MNPEETVRTLMDALQTGDFKTARSLLSSDFHFSGTVPQPLGGGPWIGLSANLKTAFPNLNYHFGIKGEVGGVVKISSSTHRHPYWEPELDSHGFGDETSHGQTLFHGP